MTKRIWVHLVHHMIYSGAEQAGSSLVHNWIGLAHDGINSLRNILEGGSDFCFGVLLGVLNGAGY